MEDRRKHPRFIKRLTTTLLVDHKSLTGISGDLSESGLFIRTKRTFAVNTLIDIELLMPDGRVSSLKGLIKRTHVSALKTGIGIEITERDVTFTDFLKYISGEKEADVAEKHVSPELQTISRLSCGVKAEDLENSLQEKRRHKRFQVKHMKVDSAMPSATDVQIINISMSGALVKADRRLDIGNKYALKIGYKDEVLFVKAVAIWSLLSQSIEDADGGIKPVYIAGMQFADLPSEKIEEIVNFIEADTQEDMVRRSSCREDSREVGNLKHGTLSGGYSVKEEGGTPPDMADAEIIDSPDRNNIYDPIEAFRKMILR
jgi:hypothetical protein